VVSMNGVSVRRDHGACTESRVTSMHIRQRSSERKSSAPLRRKVFVKRGSCGGCSRADFMILKFLAERLDRQKRQGQAKFFVALSFRPPNLVGTLRADAPMPPELCPMATVVREMLHREESPGSGR